MTQSTLTMKYGDLAADVGFYLGYGRSGWTDNQSDSIISVIKSGLRQFYFPPGQTYDWSFLRPVASLVLPSGQSVVSLPEDFSGVEGQVTLLSSTSQSYWPITWCNEAAVRQMFSTNPSQTGRPIFVSEQSRRIGPTHDQTSQLLLFPTADQTYTLQFAYYVLADALTDSDPYAYGGMAHAETILESCLAIAENRLDDMAGMHAQKFQERLQASINLDRRHKPQHIGYNGDRSDGMGYDPSCRHWQGNGITYQGSQY